MAKRRPVRKPKGKPSRKASLAERGGVVAHGSSFFRPKAKKSYNKGKNRPLPKYVKQRIAAAKTYKARAKGKRGALSKKYNAALRREMAAAGYTPDQVRASANFTLTGKAVYARAPKLRYEQIRKKTVTYKVRLKSGKYKGHLRKRTKTVITAFKYKGRWKTPAEFKRTVFMYRYNAILKHYRELYSLSMKEAQALYRALRDENYGEFVFKALY